MKEPEKKDFEDYLRNCSRLFTRLKAIIEEMERQAEETTSDDYTDAAWPFKQADRNGQKRALRKIKEILP
jgi:hypothetical protein